MSVVQSFDPSQSVQPDANSIERILRAGEALDQRDYGLSQEEIEKFAPLMHAAATRWREAAVNLDDESLVSLVRIFTLAEQLPGWHAGDRSPVIPLMAELRQRSAVPAELGSWIRSNTDNRFLPWGSLLDRL